MNIRHFSRRVSVLLVVSLFCLPVHADTEKTATERKAENIYRLLNTSSGAKQVIGGFSQEAKEVRQQAIELYESALLKMDADDQSNAAGLLNESAKTMFVAIRLSTPTVMTEEKIVADYGRRKESVSALRDAFDRISEENKGSEANKLRVDEQVDKLVSNADFFLSNGKSSQARIEIDKAYHLVKVSIDSIRSGQTLVRSLNFETPREEYLYELDRNDTHSMLVGLLIDEQKQSDFSKKSVTSKVGEANVLREQAESYAVSGAYEQAIELLEQSTQQLVRAIRSAGIYIPG